LWHGGLPASGDRARCAPFGIDASEALLELARNRVPDAELRLGDMQFLPYGDDSFDLVTGFTSFFFAADLSPPCERRAGSPSPGRRW
jgi:Methyltransferase domain